MAQLTPHTFNNNNTQGIFETVPCTVNYDDFESICRSCLAKNGVVNLFQTSHRGMLLSEIYEKLFVSSQVNKGDRLPTKLCGSCTAFVMHYYAFRKRALDSEIILQTVCREHERVSNPLDDRNDFKIEIVIESNTEIKQEVFKADDHNYSKSNNLINAEIKTVKVERVPQKQGKKKKKSKNSECANKISRKTEGNTQKKLKKKEKPETSKCKKVPSNTDTNITCSFCKDIFPTLSEYLIHRKREAHKRRTKFPCKYCNKLVKTNVMRDHMNTHTMEQPFKCDECNTTFSMRTSLRRHMYRHSDKKPLECQECGKGFIQAPLLEDHMRKHTGERLVCSFCQMEFIIRRRFVEHVKAHTLEEEVLNPNTKVPVNCNTCGKQFLTAYELINHRKRCREKKFICHLCGKYYRTKDMLKRHIFSHTGITQYICEVCGKGFKHKTPLRYHNMTHTGEKPLLCDICGRMFSWKAHLDHHMRTHTGNRPYECSFCNMTFSRMDHMKNHLRTHTREKPFACELCPKAYRYSDSLKKHKITHKV